MAWVQLPGVPNNLPEDRWSACLKHCRTCQTIASLSLTADRAVSGHPIHCRVSFDVHTTRLVTGALPLQGRGSGTLCRLNCNNVALSDNLNGV